MGVSTLSAPSVAAAGVPVRIPQWVEVETDRGETQTAQTAEFDIQLLTTASADDTITITWPLGSVTFTGVTGLVLGDTGLTFSVSYGTAAATAAALLLRLQLNYLLQRDFYMELQTSDTIRFTARYPGAKYQPSDVFSDPDTLIAHTEVTEGRDAKYQSNHSIGLVLEVEEEHGTGVYTRLPELAGEPDTAPTARVRWNVSPLLLPYTGYNWPDYGTTARLHAKDLVRRVRAYFVERYGTDPEPRILNQVVGLTKAWRAGSKLREATAWTAELFNLDAYNAAAARFLTYRGQPGEKHEVSAGQQHYLAFFDWGVNYAIEDDFILHLEVYYTDGTTDSTTVTYDYEEGQPGPGDISIYPVGFNVHGLASLQASKTPYKYKAWLTTTGSSGTKVCAPYTFWLVPEDANEQHLEFLNSFGGIESLRSVGEWESGLELTFQEAGYPRAVNEGFRPDPQQVDVVNIGNTTTETVRISTGFLDPGELAACMDLLYSPELRLVDHARSTKVGCRLLNTSHLVRRQGDRRSEHLFALNLELQVGDPDRATSQVKAFTYTP